MSYLINVEKFRNKDTNKQKQSYYFYRYPPGFIRGNQVIHLQSAEDGRCNKDRSHSTGFHEHKIEPTYVYIRLEMFSSTYPAVKSLQVEIFRRQIT